MITLTNPKRRKNHSFAKKLEEFIIQTVISGKEKGRKQMTAKLATPWSTLTATQYGVENFKFSSFLSTLKLLFLEKSMNK